MSYKIIDIKSCDGKILKCYLDALMKMSITIKNMMESVAEESEQNEALTLTNAVLTEKVLKKVIEWIEFHWDDPEPDEDFDEDKERRNKELSYWDKQFIDVDNRLLYDIIEAANFLDIPGLIEVGSRWICTNIKGKTCTEVRQILNITNDFTKEEEDRIHNENEWIHVKE